MLCVVSLCDVGNTSCEMCVMGIGYAETARIFPVFESVAPGCSFMSYDPFIRFATDLAQEKPARQANTRSCTLTRRYHGHVPPPTPFFIVRPERS